MSKHTPGRMQWHRRQDGSLYYEIGDYKTGPHAQGDIYIGEDDIARMAACWNACEGVDTQWLEECGGVESARMFSLPHWVKHADKMRAQRDELLQVLIECLECEFGVTEKSVIEKARAAINKVKGQS